jgi:ribosomal protein L37AE/L43A
MEAIRYFSDLDVATEYVASIRWPDGFICPNCQGREYSYLKTRRLWKCKACKKQTSVKKGTVFEDSPLGASTVARGSVAGRQLQERHQLV